ncbi:hypothetical protein GX563_11170 [Candidatus Bathyarchaeota archaeon]|nr:hypothetical protein [Candidatus Bathyarchaeota archaeon]
MGSAWVICKKTFSIALIFNCLITFFTIAGTLYGFYTSDWKPYAPFLIDGSIFWFGLAAGLLCIFPAAATGRSLHTGRFLFHHYVYGGFVLAAACVAITIFTPIPVFNLFFVDSSDIAVNAARVVFIAGLALLLDDLPDAALWIEHSLNWVKTKVCAIKRTMHYATLITGIFSIYLSLAMLASTLANNFYRWLPNSFGIISFFLTGAMAIAFYLRKDWLKITPPPPKQPKLFA